LIRDIVKNKSLYLLALPGFSFLVVFAYVPMTGHLIAFKDYRVSEGIWGSPWAGLEKFRLLFESDKWIQVTLNTLYLNLLFIVFSLIVALTLAVFLNEIRWAVWKRLAQSIVFLPYFVSWMVVSFIVFALLNTSDGLVNRTLARIGADTVSWYSSPQYWPLILTAIYVWKFAGYKSIIYLAAITGISGEYYESARIDGANRLQQIWHITLPLLRPTVIILTLLSIGRIFYGDFGMIYGIVGDNGVLFPTTDVIDTYTYRMLRHLGDFGMSSAIALYQSVMGLIVILIFNGIVRKVDNDSRLF
jgi:putative aldouronate transport system permease protein